MLQTGSSHDEYLVVSRSNCSSTSQLSSVATRTRGHIVADIKAHIRDLYRLPTAATLSVNDKAQITDRVMYLLEKDRYVCAENGYEVSHILARRPTLMGLWQTFGYRFMTPAISEAIFIRYFQGAKKAAHKEPHTFLERINDVFVCLFATAIYHCLKQWSEGELDDKIEFKKETRESKFSYV